jgi:predicted nuclease of predicted toxin-antitoxin system
MKFLVDAQLPYRLARFIRAKGHDVVHTDDLPNKERTSDTEIRELAKSEGRIVISKDKDFHVSHILQKEPANFLLLSTGNIVNKDLLALFEANWGAIEDLFQVCHFLELTNTKLIAHGNVG